MRQYDYKGLIISIIAGCLSIVSLVISIITTRSNVFYNTIGDVPSLLVTVLAILVTVLLAWQIVNAVQVEKDITEYKNENNVHFEKIEKDLSIMRDSIKLQAMDNECVAFSNFEGTFYKLGAWGDSLIYIINTISTFNLSSKSDETLYALNNAIIHAWKELNDEVRKSAWNEMIKDELDLDKNWLMIWEHKVSELNVADKFIMDTKRSLIDFFEKTRGDYYSIPVSQQKNTTDVNI